MEASRSKAVFTLVAGISAFAGVITLFVAVGTLDLVAFITGSVALLSSYAWSLVGSLWGRLEEVERELGKIQ